MAQRRAQLERLTPKRHKRSVVSRIVTLSAIAAALTLLPAPCWPLEINANLSLYYLPFVIASLICTWREYFPNLFERWFLRIVLASMILRSVGALWPFYFAPQAPAQPQQGERIKILVANLFRFNPAFDQLRDVIQREQPDLVGLIEFGVEAQSALELEASYPHKLGISRRDPFGIALYSRLPLGDFKLLDLGMAKLPPLVICEVKLPQGSFGFILVHTFPPVSQANYEGSYYILRRISTLARHATGPLIVAGDINATPFSQRYAKFVEWTGLQDSAWGHGLNWSWNALLPFVRLKLDHVFHSAEFSVQRYELETFDRSDHRLQIAEFTLAPDAPPFSPPATTVLAAHAAGFDAH